MKLVKIRHAGVDGTAVVPESALPHHQAAGWELVEDEPKPAPVKPAPVEKADDDEPKPAPAKRGSRRD